MPYAGGRALLSLVDAVASRSNAEASSGFPFTACMASSADENSARASSSVGPIAVRRALGYKLDTTEPLLAQVFSTIPKDVSRCARRGMGNGSVVIAGGCVGGRMAGLNCGAGWSGGAAAAVLAQTDDRAGVCRAPAVFGRELNIGGSR